MIYKIALKPNLKNAMKIFYLLLIVLFLPSGVFAAQTTKAKQAIILDYETGEVLLNKNSDSKMPTSSMSKVMTTYMVFDALKKGKITLDSEFTVSEKAWAKGGSKMFVAQGSKVRVEDLLRGVIVQSGNDATIVLAEGLAGSEEVFAKQMTRKALEMGMENSNFVNASGWPDTNHYSTAQDLSLMARRIIEDFPEYYKLFSETEFTYSDIKQANRNPLLYKNIGADGLKTGHTEAGGYGLIGTAQKNDRRVLMVINGLETQKDRTEESVRLIEWGLNSFTNVNLIKKGGQVTQADVAMGQIDSVPLVVEEAIKITVPKLPEDNYKLEIQYKSPLVAPLKAGDEVGQLKVIIPDLETRTYPIFVEQNVGKIGIMKKTITKIKYTLFGKL